MKTRENRSKHVHQRRGRSPGAGSHDLGPERRESPAERSGPKQSPGVPMGTVSHHRCARGEKRRCDSRHSIVGAHPSREGSRNEEQAENAGRGEVCDTIVGESRHRKTAGRATGSRRWIANRRARCEVADVATLKKPSLRNTRGDSVGTREARHPGTQSRQENGPPTKPRC